MPLYPATSCIQNSGKALLSPGSGWFYVQILVLLSSMDLNNMKTNHNITFASENMVSTGIFKMYLTENQALYLQNNNIAKINPISRQKQLQSSNTQALLVKAIPNWTPPEGVHITSTITDSVYTVRNATASQLLQDNRVLYAVDLPDAQLANRYANGFIQSGDESLHYYNHSLETNKIANRKGLDGKDQIVTVLDTGLDHYHSFFYDRSHPVTVNTTNMKHRKIVRYDALVDDIDDMKGHGTHVAGIVAGNPECVDCGIKLYSGMAPEAKIYFVDNAKSNQTHSTISAEVNWTSIMKNMRDMKSYITSNSWGYNYPFYAFSEANDRLAYSNPDILFMFAAGNQYHYMTISSPGDCKNILTVGATTAPKSRIYDNLDFIDHSKRNVVLGSDDDYFTVETYSEINLWNWTLDNPKKIPINAEFTAYKKDDYSDVTNKIVTINFRNIKDKTEHEKIIKQLYSNGAAALLFLKKNSPTIARSSFYRRNFIMMWPQFEDRLDDIVAMNRATILFKKNEGSGLIGPAVFTSQGPTWSLLTKPDVAVPGELTISAKSGDPYDKSPRGEGFDTLLNLSGTSMSTPALAGAVSLVRQFFVERYYPTFTKGTGKVVNPSSTLLRAMMVNAAIKTTGTDASSPDNEIGFGVPILSNIFGYNGLKLRVINDKKIESHSHHVYNIKITNKKQLSVALSYLDPPVSAEKGYILFADLDLYVEDPSGRIFVANMKPVSGSPEYSDSFATNEKVVIAASSIVNNGIYKIHVTSSVYPMDQEIKYSLVVSGDFEDANNPDPLPMTVGTTCPNNCNGKGKCVDGQCECNHGSAGFSCNQKVTKLEDGGRRHKTQVLPHKEISFFSLDYHNPITEAYPLELSFSGLTIEPIACFSTKMGPLANPDWKCYKFNKTAIQYKPASPIYTREKVYIAAFQASRKSLFGDSKTITIEVKSKYNNLEPPEPAPGPAPKPGPKPAPPPPPPPGPAPPFPPAPPIPIPDPIEPIEPNDPVNPVDPVPQPKKSNGRDVPDGDNDKNPEKNENAKNESGASNKKAVLVVGATVGGVACATGVTIGAVYFIKKMWVRSSQVEYKLSDAD